MKFCFQTNRLVNPMLLTLSEKSSTTPGETHQRSELELRVQVLVQAAIFS